MARRADRVSAAAPDPWALAAAVLRDGLAVVDGYASPPRVRELNLCAARRRERGEFRAARTGTPRAECAQPDAAIRGDRVGDDRVHGDRTRGDRIRGDPTRGDPTRGDRICWLEEPLFPAERTLLAELEALRLLLNRDGMLGAFDLEAHYAEYPPGAGYARHVDQLQGRDHRVVSLVLYLNEAWHPGAGGELRLFDAGGGSAGGERADGERAGDGDGAAGAAGGGGGAAGAAGGHAGGPAGGGGAGRAAAGYRDVEPLAGRLVCFLTAAREHAVLPTRQPRLSITGWFRRRD